jgi:hypothetical protein
MADSHDTPKQTTLTQCCSDLIRMLSYEDILSWTIYLPPMVFMAGPAAILANNPLINLALNAIVGFAISWTLHRMGHRLLMALPNEPYLIYLSQSVRLPVKLTLTQFLWMMEIIVAAAVFSGIVGRRFFLAGDALGLVTSVILFTVGLGLFFLPVYLGRLWIERYYPIMPLLGPTEEVVSKSLPGILSISRSRKGTRSE